MNIKRINHLGVLTADMEGVKKFYTDVLGLSLHHEEVYEGRAKLCFFPVGDSQIELIGPIHSDDEVAQIIAKQGEGIQHIAFEVDDIAGAIQELKGKSVSIRAGDPRPGGHGTTVAFLDPSATRGTVIELVEPADYIPEDKDKH